MSDEQRPGPYDRSRVDRKQRGRAGQRLAFLARRAGIVDPDENAVALQRRREGLLARLAPGAGLPPTAADDGLWVPIGPTAVLAGQAGGRPRVSGRVRDLRVSDDGLRAYAGTANGGVWYTGDAGETWAPLGGWATATVPAGVTGPSSVMAVGALYVRFDPGGLAAHDEVLVGTGELLPQTRTTQLGFPGGRVASVGILRAVGAVAADEFAQVWTLEGTNLAGRGVFRLAADPDQATATTSPTTFVAATSAGLFFRSGGPSPSWAVVPAAPFDTPAGASLICTDVAWSQGQGTTPTRLWVAVRDDVGTASGLLVSTAGTAGPFTPVALPGLQAHSRISVAVAPSDPSVVYALADGNQVWRIDGVTVRTVSQVPTNLLGGQDQYDQAVAVHPTRPERIVLGGATELADGQWSASLYLASVTGPTGGSYRFGFTTWPPPADQSVDAAYVGHGVHADVHAARFVPVPGATELWIGCDGGVFRSQRADADNRLVKNSFIARNTGLATLEPGYVVGHPQVDGYLLAGTQDNGTLERVGDTLWRGRVLGDGGGVAINPSAPHRWLAQYVQATWRTEGTPGTVWVDPVLRTTGRTKGATAAEKREDAQAGFYTGVDAVVTGPGAARVAFGTHRVWMSPDWGATWVTLPSYTDPMAVGAQSLVTDATVLAGAVPDYPDSQVVAVRWASADRLLVLCRRIVLQYDLAAVSAAPGFRVTRTVLSRQEPGSSEDPQAATTVASPSQVLPAVGEWSDLAVHDPGAGSHGSFYVAATGDPATPAMDSLWWFDGDDRWHATGLRTDATHGVPAPAYAVVVHPTDRQVVFVGTSVGVWKGTKTGDASWTWEAFGNGLPEATVADLSVFDAGGVRLLRAAIQARGIWEVDLQAPGTAATFLRTHAWDTRRSPTVSLTDPTRPVPNTSLSWHASPDVRVRPAQGSVPRAPVGLPWAGASGDPYGLWVLQTALHGRPDPLVKPDGQWTPLFDARLRAANAGSNGVTAAVWRTLVGQGTAFPRAFAAPWAGASPSEADLAELVVDLPAPVGSPASLGLRRGRVRIDVLVHHRHLRPVAATDVRVTLLRLDVTAAPVASWPGLATTWTAAVQTLLRTAGAVPALTGGWAFADTAVPVRSPSGPIDARLPRAVTFDADLSTVAVGSRHLLVAVVHSAVDPVVLPGSALQPLVLTTRFAVIRSLEVI